MNGNGGFVRVSEYIIGIDTITYVEFAHGGAEVHFIAGNFLAFNSPDDVDGLRALFIHVRTAAQIAEDRTKETER